MYPEFYEMAIHKWQSAQNNLLANAFGKDTVDLYSAICLPSLP